jgi:hypothetical protein
MTALLSSAQALSKVGRSVSLPDAPGCNTPSDELLAQVTRRAVAIMAPCATHELARAVTQSFAGLADDDEAFAGRIEAIVEDLIVYGDILEMRESAENGWSGTKSFVLRPAPPSFVKRKDRSIAVLGIAGDQITPLTAELNSRVIYHGALRIIRASEHEDLEALLIDLGLLKLPERTWLRLPDFETAANHVVSWRQSLAAEPATTLIEGLGILDTARSPTFYKGRWVPPDRMHKGMYVARRPQRYGAPLWCLVELENGSLRRFKDLSTRGDRLRPFDIAWRIQAALDAVSGTPQRFESSTHDPSRTTLRFYSPVPSWCERHLSIAGEKGTAERCLFCFEIPTAQLDTEAGFLREALWMAKKE